MSIRLALFVVLALLLAACGGGGDGAPSTPTSGDEQPDGTLPTLIATMRATAVGTPVTPPTATPGAERPPDVAASEDLAGRLDQPVESIDVVSVTEMEWPDTCFGLGQAGEVCAQVITPGYEVVLRLGSSEFTYRTNETGTHVRFAGVQID